MYKFTDCKTVLNNSFTIRIDPRTIQKYNVSANLSSSFTISDKGNRIRNVPYCDQDDGTSVVRLKLEQIPELNYGQEYKVVIDRPAIIQKDLYYILADDGSYDGNSVMFTVYNINGPIINTSSNFYSHIEAMKVKVGGLYAFPIFDLQNIPNRNRYTTLSFDTSILTSIIGTRAKTSSLNSSISNTLYEYGIKPKISSLNVNTNNALFESAKIYEYNISISTDFTYNAGNSNQSITGSPVISSDIMTNNITVTITPTIVNSITNISSNGSGGSATYSNGIYTINGTYSQVNTYLNSLKITTTSTYDYHTVLTFDGMDGWTNKHILSTQTLIAANRVTSNPTFNSTYNRYSYINTLPTMPDIINTFTGNGELYMYDFQNNKKVSMIFINNNDSNSYASVATPTGITAGYFARISGDGKRFIQHSTTLTGDLRVYRKSGVTNWASETSFSIDSNSLEYEKGDLDFYGNTAIAGNKLYTRASSGTSWVLDTTFNIGGNYPKNSIISQDGLVVFISTMDNSRNAKRYVFRKINGIWSNVWTSTTFGSFVVLANGQARLQNDLMSKDGSTIFMSTANMHNIDSGSYPNGIIKSYIYNSNTNTYDFFCDIESSNTLPLFAPYSCSDDGSKLITRHAVLPGSGFYLISRLYNQGISSYTHDTSIDFTINTSNDNIASISGDGNIIINTNANSTTIKTFKYYNNIWNQLANITGNSSEYAAPTISYNNSFFLGNGNKEYYTTTPYIISYDNSLNQISILATHDDLVNLKTNNMVKFIIPYENRSSDVDFIFKNVTIYGTSYRNIQLTSL